MRMKTKINWGWGLLIAIVFFMSVTVAMVVVSMNKDVNLVTDHYYEKELKYQSQIDMEKRTNKMGKHVSVKYSGNLIALTFPGATAKDSINGEIYFYRPSDGKKDFKIPVTIDEKGAQIISARNILKGYWKLQISWQQNSDHFYTEKSLIIN